MAYKDNQREQAKQQQEMPSKLTLRNLRKIDEQNERAAETSNQQESPENRKVHDMSDNASLYD